jgi:Radical SAM superfamily
MRVLLISTYELGRQPFGLASPAAWLRCAGAGVTCLDLSRQKLDPAAVREADFVAFHVPMHTATRLAAEALPQIRELNPRARLCFYGLYAPVNQSYLRSLGAQVILGGEFEEGLVAAVRDLTEPPKGSASAISLARQIFLVPDRSGLPPLKRYSHLNLPDGNQRTAGYTEASRGCKHLCRHCPIVPVYNGQFRVVAKEIVLEDIRQQAAAGAEHITFGDPDFFNGPRHGLHIVAALHKEFPHLSYDVTIKIEHLLRHAEHIRTLRKTGCLFVTSAVESVDDAVLARLAKGHTFADFAAVAELCREAGLTLSPTFVAFTPWTTSEGYVELLRRIAGLGLVDQVAPIQLAIRLLIPAGSRLLELREVRELVQPFDEKALVYPWRNPDPRVDELCVESQELVQHSQARKLSRGEIFALVWELAHKAAGLGAKPLPNPSRLVSRATIPYLTEPWYC